MLTLSFQLYKKNTADQASCVARKQELLIAICSVPTTRVSTFKAERYLPDPTQQKTSTAVACNGAEPCWVR